VLGVSPDLSLADFRVCPLVTGVRLWDDFLIATTVLIVDDHPAFRASARRMLEDEGFDVVGEAADGASGLDLARELKPEVVLLDVVLPDRSGFDVAEQLGGPTVVMTSSHARRDLGPRLDRSSAVGFVSKDELSGEKIRELLRRAA
jgi:DNA-binding NarL/FixJ family response regulator